MPPIGPLQLRPIYRQYIWGGRRLETVLARDLPDADRAAVFAESWDVADHDQGQSVVESGAWGGRSLGDLVRNNGPELLGRHHPQERFPLMLKYLDAAANLSVQVHPDDALAARMGLSDPGKTEAWVVLDAEPGSRLWAGLVGRPGRATLEEAISTGTLEHHLHVIEPSAGDCIYLPAGTVHALGAGLLVAEIQQTSNNTFRMYDFNRLDAHDRPRELHVEQALSAINYDQGPVAPVQPRPTGQADVERLVECRRFILDRHCGRTTRTIDSDGRFHILTVLDGQVEIAWSGAEPLSLARGGSVLLPATSGPVELLPSSGSTPTLLDAYLP